MSNLGGTNARRHVITAGNVRTYCRGIVNPLILRLVAEHGYDYRQSMVIAGFARSGTTWLAEVVARTPNTAILFEPVNFEHVPQARAAGFDWDNFRVPGELWPEGEAFLKQVLSGRVLNRWTTSNIPVAKAISARRWIVKLIRANQMLVWMTQTLELAWPVLIIRHPCAVYSSWASRGWPLLQQLHQNTKFLETYPQFSSYLRTLRTPEEFFAVRWCESHYHTLNAPKPWPFQLVFYENLMSGGTAEVQRILERWNLNAAEDTSRALLTPSAKASHSFNAKTGAQVVGWRRQLDPNVVARILAVVRAYGLDFYRQETAPDLSHPLISLPP